MVYFRKHKDSIMNSVETGAAIFGSLFITLGLPFATIYLAAM